MLSSCSGPIVALPVTYFYPLPNYCREDKNPKQWIKEESYTIQYFHRSWFRGSLEDLMENWLYAGMGPLSRGSNRTDPNRCRLTYSHTSEPEQSVLKNVNKFLKSVIFLDFHNFTWTILLFQKNLVSKTIKK